MSEVIFTAGSAPATPDAGRVTLYVKADNKLYYKDETGVELPMRSTGPGTGDLLADGTVPLTADWDVGAFEVRARTFESDVATGTAPLVIASTTLVTNLNADLLDGNHAAAFAVAAHTHEGTAILSTGEAGGTKFLREDGDNTCSWQTVPAAGIANVVEDTTPQLGGSLDVNGQKIVSVTNGNIDIEPHGTGNVLLGNFTLDADQAVGVGQDNYVFTYDNATGLISLEAAVGGGLANIVEDVTPQLGGALDGQGHDLNNLGVVFLTEQAAAEADVAGKGQFWVKTETPNVPMFTDDAGNDFRLSIEEVFTSDIATVADQDYVLWYDAPWPGTVTKVRTDCASGTCTLTGKVNTTALGGTANSVSSVAQEQAHASTNTFVKGDKLQFTVSANAACLTMAVAFYLTRTG